MALRRPGDKPLSESILVYLTDAYMRHSASMSWRKLTVFLPYGRHAAYKHGSPMGEVSHT